MWVLIDGHNALSALGIQGRTHAEARMNLLQSVRTATSSALVFFDARNAPSGLLSSTRECGVPVRYCRHREADAAIIEMVRDAGTPESLIVVTNDREVAGRCAQLGARAMGVQEFFGPRKHDAPSSSGPTADPRRIRSDRLHFKPSDFGLPDFVDLGDPDLGDPDSGDE